MTFIKIIHAERIGRHRHRIRPHRRPHRRRCDCCDDNPRHEAERYIHKCFDETLNLVLQISLWANLSAMTCDNVAGHVL